MQAVPQALGISCVTIDAFGMITIYSAPLDKASA